MSRCYQGRLSARAPILLGLVAALILVGGAGSWAAFGQIAGAIVVPGRVEVARDRHVVQHPSGGVVSRVHVANGESVAKGAKLVEIDKHVLVQQLEAARMGLAEARAILARLNAERNGLAKMPGAPEDIDALDRAALEGQRKVFNTRHAALSSSREQLVLRASQLHNHLRGLEAKADALDQQKDLVSDALDAQSQLLKQGLVPAVRVSSLRRDMAELSGALGENAAARAQVRNAMAEIDNQTAALDLRRAEEIATQLRQSRLRATELDARVVALSDQLERTTLRAPVAGVVHQISAPGLDGVISGGQPLMVIVPQDRPRVIRAEVPAQRIGDVREGQVAHLRPLGTSRQDSTDLTGYVAVISPESIPASDASPDPVFEIDIALDPGVPHLTPGVPVEVFLRTADRRPIVYLTEPLTRFFGSALRDG